MKPACGRQGGRKHRLNGDLLVGATGLVEGEVDARNVVIQGAVSGKLTARNQLEIKPSGRLTGECSAASIEIKEGAPSKAPRGC